MAVAVMALVVTAAAVVVTRHHTRPVEDAVRYRSNFTHGPGSALPGGLMVPPGAHLVGAVLPAASTPDPRAWSATFVATSPKTAFNDLIRQIRPLAPFGRTDCTANWEGDAGGELRSLDGHRATEAG